MNESHFYFCLSTLESNLYMNVYKKTSQKLNDTLKDPFLVLSEKRSMELPLSHTTFIIYKGIVYLYATSVEGYVIVFENII